MILTSAAPMGPYRASKYMEFNHVQSIVPC